jgi:hypothetical protein
MSGPIDYAPGQNDGDIPERGWNDEPCLHEVQDNDRFVTYCAFLPGHEGDHNDRPQS